jgi:hypothetical protein
MKIKLTVTGSSLRKQESHEFDVPSVDHGLIELAKKLKCSVTPDKTAYNQDGTTSTKATLFFGNGIKDPVVIITNFL